jgi:hypothetical protein
MVQKRFGVKAADIPDGFWFFPVVHGGMEIRNPFVPLVNMRESYRQTPNRILDKAMENEDDDYVAAKHTYDRINAGWGLSKYNSGLKTALNMAGDEPFISKNEYLMYREERSKRLSWAYQELLTVPDEQQLSLTPEVAVWLATVDAGGRKDVISGNWHSMNAYWQSVVTSYGKDIFDKFGSLKMVDSAQVPLGVVSVMKSSKVKWQG